MYCTWKMKAIEGLPPQNWPSSGPERQPIDALLSWFWSFRRHSRSETTWRHGFCLVCFEQEWIVSNSGGDELAGEGRKREVNVGAPSLIRSPLEWDPRLKHKCNTQSHPQESYALSSATIHRLERLELDYRVISTRQLIPLPPLEYFKNQCRLMDINVHEHSWSFLLMTSTLTTLLAHGKIERFPISCE